jgi:uncharacterized DUF497 family protein
MLLDHPNKCIYSNLREDRIRLRQRRQEHRQAWGFLTLAESLEWELLLATEDTREDYDEVRLVGFAPIGRTVYCVVFTENDDVYRVVSLRKALPKEVRAYASQI